MSVTYYVFFPLVIFEVLEKPLNQNTSKLSNFFFHRTLCFFSILTISSRVNRILSAKVKRVFNFDNWFTKNLSHCWKVAIFFLQRFPFFGPKIIAKVGNSEKTWTNRLSCLLFVSSFWAIHTFAWKLWTHSVEKTWNLISPEKYFV